MPVCSLVMCLGKFIEKSSLYFGKTIVQGGESFVECVGTIIDFEIVGINMLQFQFNAFYYHIQPELCRLLDNLPTKIIKTKY